jgi:uncharacterized membrane protein
VYRRVACFCAHVRLYSRRFVDSWSISMGLLVLVLGLVLFLGPHVFVTMRDQRAEVIKRGGEWSYKGLFAILTIVGLYLTGKGFGMYYDAGPIEIWSPPSWTRYITQALVWPAAIFVTAAYLPGDIKRTLKHPMLVGVKLWAVAHLISNGDLGGIILFGAVLAWAVYDRISLKRRSDPGGPPIPVGGRRNDIAAVIVGTILYLALGLVFHPLVVGLAVFGRPAFGT